MFQCYYAECGQTYKTRFNLRRHINSSHLKIKSFVCLECSKHFVSKQNLKEHHYIHTGEKPFPCDEPGCCKRFRQVSQLSIHKRIHYRQRVGAKVCQEIPRLRLSGICGGWRIPECEEKKPEHELALPMLGDVQECSGKLPVMQALLGQMKLVLL